jgi:hypothetical protein
MTLTLSSRLGLYGLNGSVWPERSLILELDISIGKYANCHNEQKGFRSVRVLHEMCKVV